MARPELLQINSQILGDARGLTSLYQKFAGCLCEVSQTIIHLALCVSYRMSSSSTTNAVKQRHQADHAS